MIKIYEFKECTCDVCGDKKNIEISSALPKKWKAITVIKRYDLCEECLTKVDNAISEMVPSV